MSLAVTVDNVQEGGGNSLFDVLGRITASSSYVAGGDALSFASAEILAGRTPVDVQIKGESGFVYRFDPGTSIANGKMLVYCPGNMLRRRTIITTAQVLALNATPITLIPAPGALLANILEGICVHKPAGTAYGGIAGGEDLSVKYTDGSGLEVLEMETTGFLDQATAQTRWANAFRAASGISSITPVIDAAMVIQMLVGEITTGTSDLHIESHYRIVTCTTGVPVGIIGPLEHSAVAYGAAITGDTIRFRATFKRE